MTHRGYRPDVDDSYEAFVGEIVPRINAALDMATRALVWTGPHIHEQRKPDAIGGVFCPAGTGRHVWGFKQFLPALLSEISRLVGLGGYGLHPFAWQA
jgi:hypothetical protein